MHMALKAHRWTRADIYDLPEDGNRYEVIDGALYVVAPPSPGHDRIRSVLSELLRPFVKLHGLGDVYDGRPAFAPHDDLVEPDLIVTKTPWPLPERWETFPVPLLVVEVLSPSTARHDRIVKRDFYRRAQVPGYWIVDGKNRAVTVVTPRTERVVRRQLTWAPRDCPASLDIDLPGLFAEALG
jgi:Uma2 family endonuclease